MDLNLFKNMINSIKKDDKVQNFLNELKKTIENTNDDIGILEKIQSENKVSIGTKNQMELKMDEILKDYAKETAEKGDLYFIVEKSKTDKTYTIYKYEMDDDSVLKILQDELPQNAGVNTALRTMNGKYIIDEEATKELENKINNMANELLEEQNKILNEYRKEGHLYRVSENINNCIFLWDITDESKMEVEEVDFPEDLLGKATEGAIFEYLDGSYKLKENPLNI